MNDLLKTQEHSTESPLDRALKLNQELQALRKKNIALQDENENIREKNESLSKDRAGLVQLVKDLNTELDDLKTSSKATEKKLYGELKNMQTSWDSLYNEYRAAEEKHERERRQQKTGELQTTSSCDEGKTREKSQREMISSVIKKQSSASNKKVSPLERRLYELHDEKKKLQSELVKLRTLYREEKYKNDNRDLPLYCTDPLTDDSSDSSPEQDVPASRPNLFASLSNRNLIGRPSMSSTSNGASSISKSTRNLWGKVRTSSRNLQQKFGSESINLALSYD